MSLTHEQRCARIAYLLISGEGKPLWRNDNPQQEMTCQECSEVFSGHVLEKYCKGCREVVHARQKTRAHRKWNGGKV